MRLPRRYVTGRNPTATTCLPEVTPRRTSATRSTCAGRHEGLAAAPIVAGPASLPRASGESRPMLPTVCVCGAAVGEYEFSVSTKRGARNLRTSQRLSLDVYRMRA